MSEVMKELAVPAEINQLQDVLAFLETALTENGCSVKTQMRICLAAEEIFVNIANYAYAPGKGTAVVRVSFLDDPRRAVVSFADTGVPFDPLKKADPDVTLSAEEREIGGLGIFMIKKTMDDMQYEYKDGHNILTLIKNF